MCYRTHLARLFFGCSFLLDRVRVLVPRAIACCFAEPLTTRDIPFSPEFGNAHLGGESGGAKEDLVVPVRQTFWPADRVLDVEVGSVVVPTDFAYDSRPIKKAPTMSSRAERGICFLFVFNKKQLMLRSM